MSKLNETVKDSLKADRTKAKITLLVILVMSALTILSIDCMDSKTADINDTTNSNVTVETLCTTCTNEQEQAVKSLKLTTTTSTVTTTTSVTTTTLVPFELQHIGNDKVGFIDVPKNWKQIEDDNIVYDDYIEYAGVYEDIATGSVESTTNEKEIETKVNTTTPVLKDDSIKYLEYSSIALEYGELGDKSKTDFIDAEAKQFAALDNYFNSDKKETIDISVADDVNTGKYCTKCTINNEEAYKFETKLINYYNDLGYGDGYLIVYIMFLPDDNYMAITVETNTSDKPFIEKLISTYSFSRKGDN